MSKVIDVSNNSFEVEVNNSDKVVLVEFGATWCGPCKNLLPILEQFAEDVGDAAKVVKVDVDESPNVAATFNVRAVPTLIAVKDGKEISRHVGIANKNKMKEMLGIK